MYIVINFMLTTSFMNTCIHVLCEYNAACLTLIFRVFKDKFGKVCMRNLLLRPGVASFP